MAKPFEKSHMAKISWRDNGQAGQDQLLRALHLVLQWSATRRWTEAVLQVISSTGRSSGGSTVGDEDVPAGRGGMINPRNPSFTQGKECSALRLKRSTAWSIIRGQRICWVSEQTNEEEKTEGTAGQELETTAYKKERYTVRGKKGQGSTASRWVKEEAS